jgi:hypothetical protein
MPKTSSLKNKTISAPDNTPMTGMMLLQSLAKMYHDPELKPALEKPITMSSDEEGNDMLKLWQMDVSKTGAITLWPAHI